MIKFRLHSAIAVAALITALGAIPLTTQGGFLLALPFVPLAVAIWAWRAGTDANEQGLFIRKVVGSRAIAWDQVSAFVPEQQKVKAVLTDGKSVRLTAVRPADLPKLVGASGTTLQRSTPV